LSLTVIYSLIKIETETEIDIISLSETERETEMFCEMETKYKLNQSTQNVIVIETKLITK